MADDILEQPQQPAINPEVARMMELSLNLKPSTEPVTEPIVSPDPALPANQVIDVFAPFKEKFGYAAPEDALKEIEELRSFKANPIPAELKFENAQSEQLFKALKEGNQKEVYQILAKQDRLDSLTSLEVNKDNAADIIKLGMQLKYQDLTQAEIDYKFNKQFALPKSPVQDTVNDESDEDFANRKAAWQETVNDIEMSKVIEAKLAKPELESAKAKIVLPETNTPVDEAYLQYVKQLEEQPKRDAEISAAYKTLTPKAIETKMNFTDEANKIAFEFQYEPDSESFNKSIDFVTDMKSFFNSFVNQDGTPDRKRFLDAIHFAMNKEKILMEAMNQSKNATIKSFLPDNSQPGLVRQLTQAQEPTELEKQMKMALHGYGR